MRYEIKVLIKIAIYFLSFAMGPTLRNRILKDNQSLSPDKKKYINK